MSDEELFKKAMSHEFYSGTMFDARELALECACRMDELRRDLAVCAAGPWRTDVENAPKDGSEIQAEFEAHKGTRRLFAEWDSVCDRWLTANGHYDDDLLIAFAVPNPPQVKP